jgi:hypothetical protein
VCGVLSGKGDRYGMDYDMKVSAIIEMCIISVVILSTEFGTRELTSHLDGLSTARKRKI